MIRVAAVVLAAGRSSRMGAQNKLLADIGGKPMVRRVVETALASKARPVLVVPTGTPLAEAQRRAGEAGRADSALGVADSTGRMVALVHGPAADAVPADRRPWVAVDTVARDIAGIPAIPAGLRGEEVIKVVQANPGAEYVVTAGEDVVGVLRLADLAALLEPRSTR